MILYAGIALLSLILISIGIYFLSLRRVVVTNEVHIVQRENGTFSYGKEAQESKGNAYYCYPSWMPKIGVAVSKLPTNIFEADLKEYKAADKDSLPFSVSIKAFYRISDFSLASSRIFKIQELKNQVEGIIQCAVRSILSDNKLSNIMAERNKYGKLFTEMVEPQLKEWGITLVTNIELLGVHDTREEQLIENIVNKKKSTIESEAKIVVAENLAKVQEVEQSLQDNEKEEKDEQNI